MWDRGKRAATADPSSAEDLLALDRLVGGADVVLVGTSGPGLTYHDLLDRGQAPGEPCCWVVMPPYLLGETPWAGGQESAGLLFAWLGHAWNQSSYADVPVDCLFPVALHMQGIWAATSRSRCWPAVSAASRSPRWRSRAARTAPSWSRPAPSPPAATSRTSTGPAVLAAPCPTTGPTAAPTASGCSSAAFTNAFIERGLTAVGAGWIFDGPAGRRRPGNLRLPKNLTWIARELEKVFATRPRDEWLDLLEAADCPAAPVNEPGRWLDHDQVTALGLRVEAVTDTGQDDRDARPAYRPLADAGQRPRARCQLLARDHPAAAAVVRGRHAAAAPGHGGQPSPAPREPEPQPPLSGSARA